MKKVSIQGLVIISIITICLSVIGLVNVFKMSGDGVTYERAGSNVVVSYVPLNTAGYRAGLQIGDTLIDIGGRTYRSLYDLKRNIIEKIGAGKIALYNIKRDNRSLTIPVKLDFQYRRTFVSFLMILSFIFIFTSLVFYVTFPYPSITSLHIYIFYQLISMISVYSLVSFLTIPLYVVLILSSSFAPAIIIFFARSLEKNFGKREMAAPFFLSSAIAVTWFAFYLYYALTITYESFSVFLTALRVIQVFISFMIIWGITETVRTIFGRVRESEKIYISYVLLFLFIGYIPFIMLYALPMIFVKREILPLWISTFLSIIPLFGIIIFNSFFYRVARKEE